MLIPDHTNGYCRHTFVNDGACCCNCIHRYLLISDEGMPMGYYCLQPELDMVTFIGFEGHSMCELHCRENGDPFTVTFPIGNITTG